MPLTDPVPSSSFDVLERNIQDTDKFVNQETGTFTNRVGKQVKPIPVIEAEANAAVISLGWHQVGLFADGFTYLLQNDIAKDAAGDWYRWNGALPKVVTAGTLPSSDANFVKIDYKSHADLTDRNPADGSAHNADDVAKNGGGSVQTFIDETTNNISDLNKVITVTNISQIASINKPTTIAIYSSLENKHFDISEIINGLQNTPDTIKMLDGRYANRVGGFKPQRLGVFKTSTKLKHRAGDLLYEKLSQTEAKLITDLSHFKSFTYQDVDKDGLTIGYVSWEKGLDNTGDGLSWSTAKATLSAGYALDTDILLVRGGLYNRAQRLNDIVVSKNRAIIGVGGAVITGPVVTGVWSKTATYDNVYQLDYSAGLTNTTSNVYDTAALNAQLAPISYTPVGSVALVETTPASFFHTGTTTYVHAADSRDLTKTGDRLRLIQPVSNSKITYTGDYKFYLENIHNWGGSGNGVTLVSDGGNYENSIFYNKNCTFNAVSGGSSNGISVRDIGLCISESSDSSANRRDGFNYHNYLAGVQGSMGVAPHFIEINCSAHGNGLGGSENNNQGSTAHEDCVGFRINGDYSGHSDGGCIVDIEAVKAYNVCCKTKNSSRVGQSLAADGYDRGDGLKTAEWWIDGAYCKNNPIVSNGGGDLATDGYHSIVHMQDTDTEKPISTRAFTQMLDEDFS